MTDVRSIPSIEKRCQSRRTCGFVTAETLNPLADKLVGIIGDRRMVKVHRYLERVGTPTVLAGLRPGHSAMCGAVSRRPGQSVTVYLTSQSRSLQSVGFASWQEESEEVVRQRYHHPEEQWLGQRRDITFVELDGWPGQPGRDDSVRIEHWNEHGVGQETLLVFDDIDVIEEIAWDVKGDRERRVYMWDEFCDVHGLHFEHPEHRGQYGCKGRKSTRAEDLAVLASIAQAGESLGISASPLRGPSDTNPVVGSQPRSGDPTPGVLSDDEDRRWLAEEVKLDRIQDAADRGDEA